jgi:cytidylate kinase
VKPLSIAIDGPAASGKSTVGGILAARLGYLYFDTGVMYRAVTWAALNRGIAIDDEPAVTRLAEEIAIEMLPPTEDDGRQFTVRVDGTDITWDIRSAEVNRYVSPVSAYVGVRKALLHKQREIGAAGKVIMVGRDIGTVILPEADVKIYLDATLEERARRRYLESVERDPSRTFEDVLQEVRRRDEIDSSRAEAPLRVADGATVIDSTNMRVQEVVDCIEAVIRNAGGA